VTAGIFAPAISYNPHNDTFLHDYTFVREAAISLSLPKTLPTWSDPIWFT
jgi:alpha-N-arabinofuranosidase